MQLITLRQNQQCKSENSLRKLPAPESESEPLTPCSQYLVEEELRITAEIQKTDCFSAHRLVVPNLPNAAAL